MSSNLKVKLPNSNVEITKITFGAWAIGGWMWGGNDDNDAIKALNKAIEVGMTSIDTAPVYGFGHSEELVGKVIKGRRSDVQILTKFGLRWDKPSGNVHGNSKDEDGNPVSIYKLGSKENLIEECENSLKRLGTDYIDYYQQHWPDKSIPVSETMEGLNLLKEQGKILAGGVSNYSVDQMKEAVKTFGISCNQVPYSMLERGIESDLVPWSIENGYGIIAYSPLQRGVLTGKIDANYTFNEGDHRADNKYFKEPILNMINEFISEYLTPLAERKNCTIAQVVLKWTLLQDGITAILAGARNEKQVEDNWNALSISLTEEELSSINTGLEKLHTKIAN